MSLIKIKVSHTILCRRAFKASWTASISRTLIWSSFSWEVYDLAVVKSCRCSPQPTCEVLVNRRYGGALGEGLQMPTSPLAATIWCIVGTLLMIIYCDCLVKLQLPLEGMHLDPASGTKHSREAMLPHLCRQVCQMKKLFCYILESGNPRICWMSPLLDSVHLHSKILSLVGQPEVWFLHIDDNPQVLAELEDPTTF